MRVGAVMRMLAVVRVRRGVRGGGRGAVSRVLRLVVGILRVGRRVVVVVVVIGRGVLGNLRTVLGVVAVVLRLRRVVQVSGVRLVGDERGVSRRR